MLNPKKSISLIAFLLFIMLPFNNCDHVDSGLFTVDQNSSSVQGLYVMISGTGSIRLSPEMQIFNIQGSCDSASYIYSEIYWTIDNLSGQTVLDSYSASGGSQFLAACVNNSYSINVLVPCPGAINTSSGCYGLTQQYKLSTHIKGLTVDGNNPAGAFASSNSVALSP